MTKNSRLVYSTETGRVKPNTAVQATSTPTPSDGVVRIRRETKGRGGKAVCVIQGLPSEGLTKIAKQLKAACACGGAVKDGLVEIQGDHRDKLKTTLEKQGFTVKLAGG